MVSEIDRYVIQKVKEYREAKGYSQLKLSNELDTSSSLVSKVESGKYGKKYNVFHLNEIARVLECSPKDFLPEKPLKNKIKKG